MDRRRWISGVFMRVIILRRVLIAVNIGSIRNTIRTTTTGA